MTSDEPKFGATGQFPRGKIDKHDEGEINIGVAADMKHQIVRIMFGTPVKWLGLPKTEALELADLIKKHAEALK
jgi:hypothetical protein